VESLASQHCCQRVSLSQIRFVPNTRFYFSVTGFSFDEAMPGESFLVSDAEAPSFLVFLAPPICDTNSRHVAADRLRPLSYIPTDASREEKVRMGKIESHRDLIVWQKSMDLVVLIYQLSSQFPSNEIYRLVAQITRSATSVPANIAEGHARATKRDYSHYLSIAKGSTMETETFMMLSVRLGYLTETEAQPALSLITEISKMLTALRAKLAE
jgi:four helix bundle protein